MKNMRRMNLSSLLTPKGMDLRDYQVTGVKHILKGRRRGLFDDMGLGKTIQSIVGFNTLKAKTIVIVCPPAVVYSWAAEIEIWSTWNYSIHIVSKRLDWIPETTKRQVVIVPYSLVSHPNILEQLKDRRWGVAIFDEIHNCKSVSAQRTAACIGPSGLIQYARYAWALSGTPMTNTPDDLYPVFKAFAPKLIRKTPNLKKFKSRYCIQMGSWPRVKTVGAKNLGELRAKLFDSGFAIMRNKADVLNDLPPKQYRMLPVDGDKSLSISIDDIDPLDIAAAHSGKVPGDLAEIRKEAGLAKLGAVARYVDDILATTKKLVIFAWHQDVVRAIRDQLEMDGVLSSVYYGATSTKEKELAKRFFIENDECRVFIGNIASAGTGLDGLQKVCSHALFAEPPWTYSEIAQASDRLHRYGQKNPVTIDISILTNSIEEYIVKAVLKKEGYFKKTLNTRFTITQ